MKKIICSIAAAALFSGLLPAQVFAQPPQDIKEITTQLHFYVAGGLQWQGDSQQNTNWNKICEDTEGRIWFSGGDHWGTDRTDGTTQTRYDRPWGYGNTAICCYDPKTDKAEVMFELDRASSIFSDAETPGHGKIHSNIVCDPDGNIWTGGYMGASYNHEWADQYYPKSYAGGAIIKYNPETKDVDYYGIPNPGGGLVSIQYDAKRHVVHGVTVDRARYFRLNVDTMELKRYDIARFSSRETIVDRDGNVWFPNEFSSLTKFDPDTETYTDFDTKIPGLRASYVTKDNVIYGICPAGFLWSWDTKSNKVEEYGHVTGTPDKRVYTPNMAVDEQFGRIYFLAGSHGINLSKMPILTIFDMKTKKFIWLGGVDVDGCFGSVVGSDHKVYFSCYAYDQKNGKRLKDKDGKEYIRPFLLRYDPPRSLEEGK